MVVSQLLLNIYSNLSPRLYYVMDVPTHWPLMLLYAIRYLYLGLAAAPCGTTRRI